MFITDTVVQFFPICIALYSFSSGAVFTSSDCLHLYICDLTMDTKVVKDAESDGGYDYILYVPVERQAFIKGFKKSRFEN